MRKSLRRLYQYISIFMIATLPGACPAFATTFATKGVQVAFLQKRDDLGHVIDLEPGGRGFFHVAVSYQGQWLHSHPRGGVQLSPDLAPFGELAAVLKSTGYTEPSTEIVNSILGRPYDPYFSWGDQAYYCSEMIAKIFQIDPKPMRFDGEYWRKYFALLHIVAPSSAPGVSPDGVYNGLIEKGFLPFLTTHGLVQEIASQTPCSAALTQTLK